MSSLELTSAVTALASLIACSLTVEKMVLVVSILVQLGDTLAMIATRESLCEKQNG